MYVAVAELTGADAITREAGQKLFDLIHPALECGEPITLDFQGVDVFVSPYLNAAIGQLYRDFSSDDIRRFLQIANMSRPGLSTLQVVVDTAKSVYSDPAIADALQAAITQELVSES